jgi:hypothetical protein
MWLRHCSYQSQSYSFFIYFIITKTITAYTIIEATKPPIAPATIDPISELDNPLPLLVVVVVVVVEIEDEVDVFVKGCDASVVLEIAIVVVVVDEVVVGLVEI